MELPKDKVMLLSVINTALRDKYHSLEELCNAEGVDAKEIEEALSDIGYEYEENLNRFV